MAIDKDVETGFAICDVGGGKLAKGRQVFGSHDRVNIPLCETGRTVGTWHTHPQGVAKPSPLDVSEAERLNFDFVCITVPDTRVTRCFPVSRR